MATDRRSLSQPESGDEPLTEQQALVVSLHAAVEALTACVETIYDLIGHVDAMAQAEATHRERRRARVSYGGGLSPLASLTQNDYTIEHLSLPGTPALSGGAGPADSRDLTARAARPGASALMAATDLAHRGYSRDEIAERLHDRWGEEATQILEDLLE